MHVVAVLFGVEYMLSGHETPKNSLKKKYICSSQVITKWNIKRPKTLFFNA